MRISGSVEETSIAAVDEMLCMPEDTNSCSTHSVTRVAKSLIQQGNIDLTLGPRDPKRLKKMPSIVSITLVELRRPFFHRRKHF